MAAYALALVALTAALADHDHVAALTARRAEFDARDAVATRDEVPGQVYKRKG